MLMMSEVPFNLMFQSRGVVGDISSHDEVNDGDDV